MKTGDKMTWEQFEKWYHAFGWKGIKISWTEGWTTGLKLDAVEDIAYKAYRKGFRDGRKAGTDNERKRWVGPY